MGSGSSKGKPAAVTRPSSSTAHRQSQLSEASRWAAPRSAAAQSASGAEDPALQQHLLRQLQHATPTVAPSADDTRVPRDGAQRSASGATQTEPYGPVADEKLFSPGSGGAGADATRTNGAPQDAPRGAADGAGDDGLREMVGSNSLVQAGIDAARERLQLVVQLESVRAELRQTQADNERLRHDLEQRTAAAAAAAQHARDLDVARTELARVLQHNAVLTAQVSQLLSAETHRTPRSSAERGVQAAAAAGESSVVGQDELRHELDRCRMSERGLSALNTALQAKMNTLEWELSLLRSDLEAVRSSAAEPPPLHRPPSPEPPAWWNALPPEFSLLPADVFVCCPTRASLEPAVTLASCLRPSHACYLHITESDRDTETLMAQCVSVLFVVVDEPKGGSSRNWRRSIDCAVQSKKPLLVVRANGLDIRSWRDSMAASKGLLEQLADLPFIAFSSASPETACDELRRTFLGPDRVTCDWLRDLIRGGLVRESDHPSDRSVVVRVARAPIWRLLFAMQSCEPDLFARVTELIIQEADNIAYVEQWAHRVAPVPSLRHLRLLELAFDDASAARLFRLFPRLESFSAVFSDASACLVSGGLFATLAESAPALRSLSLENCPEVSLLGLASLSACTSLRRLALRRFPNAAEGLKSFKAGFELIEELDVGGTDRLWDSSLGFVAKGCPRLRALAIDSWTMFGTGLKLLPLHCSALECLSLARCNVTDKMLEPLQKCIVLRQVDLGWSKITDVGLAVLAAGCTNLTHLRLSGCAVRGPGLEELARSCRSLQALDLAECDLERGALTSVCRAATSLLALRIDRMQSLADSELVTMAESCHVLHTLSIIDTPVLTDVALGYLQAGFPSLRTACVGVRHGLSAAVASFVNARPSVALEATSASFWTFPLSHS